MFLICIGFHLKAAPKNSTKTVRTKRNSIIEKPLDTFFIVILFNLQSPQSGGYDRYQKD